MLSIPLWLLYISYSILHLEGRSEYSGSPNIRWQVYTSEDLYIHCVWSRLGPEVLQHSHFLLSKVNFLLGRTYLLQNLNGATKCVHVWFNYEKWHRTIHWHIYTEKIKTCCKVTHNESKIYILARISDFGCKIHYCMLYSEESKWSIILYTYTYEVSRAENLCMCIQLNHWVLKLQLSPFIFLILLYLLITSMSWNIQGSI